MDTDAFPETLSSPRPRPATPKKPDRLRAQSIPAPPMTDMGRPIPSIIDGHVSNNHESVGPAEFYADVVVASPSPKPSWTNGTFLENEDEQAKAGAIQSADELDLTSSSTDEQTDVRLQISHAAQELPLPRLKHWSKVKQDTKVSRSSSACRNVSTGPSEKDSSPVMAWQPSTVRGAPLSIVS